MIRTPNPNPFLKMLSYWHCELTVAWKSIHFVLQMINDNLGKNKFLRVSLFSCELFGRKHRVYNFLCWTPQNLPLPHIHRLYLKTGPVSWACDLCNHIGPHTQKDSMLGLMLLLSWNSKFLSNEPLYFHFALDPHKSHRQSC